MPHILQFPSAFKYAVKSVEGTTTTLFAAVKTLKECESWVSEFSALNNTNWITRDSAPSLKRLVCSKNRKSSKEQKNCECPAKISIQVKSTTKDTIKKSRHVKEGKPAIIIIMHSHTHSLDTAEALAALPASKETRQLFQMYFDNGMGITEAINCHINKLELEFEEADLANGAINPKYRSVRYWYDQWRTSKLDPRSGKGMLEKLQEKQTAYLSKNITIECDDDPMTVVIVTPLMRRAHSLAKAADIVFIDSTASCDADNHSITFILTICPAGAVPLAIIISTSQSKCDYIKGFELVQKAV